MNQSDDYIGKDGVITMIEGIVSLVYDLTVCYNGFKELLTHKILRKLLFPFLVDFHSQEY